MLSIKRIFLPLFVLLHSVVVYGQGEPTNGTKKITFSPQWTAQAQFAGYYAAKDMGFYDEVGLDVEIVHPSKSVSALQMLKSEQSDFVSLDLITAVSENMGGGTLCNIMQSSQSSGFAILSHEPIAKIEDLEGKRIGRWSAGFSLSAQSAIENLGVDVEWIDILGGVNVFLSKAVDANLMMTYNELLTVEETGYEINPNQVIYFRDIEEYNIPEDGVYTSAAFAKNNPEVVAKFREATAKGWLWVRENSDEALNIVIEWAYRDNIPTNIVHQRMMLDETISLQKNELGEFSTTLDMSDFDRVKSLLLESGLGGGDIEYRSFIK